MVLSGIAGSLWWLTEFVDDLGMMFGPHFRVTASILMGILGGLMVMAGIMIVVSGGLLTTPRVLLGRKLLLVSVITGVMGLAASLVQSVLSNNIVIDISVQIPQSVGWVGAILSVIALNIADQGPLVAH